MAGQRSKTALTLALVSVVLLLTAVPTAGARSRWFGASLKRAPDATATCQSFFFFQPVASCSWDTSGALYNPRESMVVPGTGTITRLQVKVGAHTGRMRFAILESLRKQNAGETACCIGRRQTQVIRPRTNRITTLHVHIPVSVAFNRKSRIYSFDNLFLTMEDAHTVIPANLGNTNAGNCSGGWFPAVRPHRENFTGPYGVCGYTILVRAFWTPKPR